MKAQKQHPQAKHIDFCVFLLRELVREYRNAEDEAVENGMVNAPDAPWEITKNECKGHAQRLARYLRNDLGVHINFLPLSWSK